MREIKFRVLIDREMYYQDKYEAYGDNLSSIDICKETITITSFYNYEDVYRFEDEEVKLMQYTGAKDKNGTEIYEGDIVKIIKSEGYGEYYEQVKYTGKIEYCVSEFRIQPLNLKLSDENIVEIKVIGNIYESKNLLEENRWADTK